MTTELQKRTVYIISDGTGETASSMTRAALVHFRDYDISIVRCKNVRTEVQAEALIDEVFQKRGFLIHTVASESLRKKILEESSLKGVPCVDLLGPLLSQLKSFMGVEPEKKSDGR